MTHKTNKNDFTPRVLGIRRWMKPIAWLLVVGVAILLMRQAVRADGPTAEQIIQAERNLRNLPQDHSSSGNNSSSDESPSETAARKAYDQGFAAYKRSDWSTAMTYFQTALETDPCNEYRFDVALVWMKQGNAMLDSGEMTNALADFRQAESYVPNFFAPGTLEKIEHWIANDEQMRLKINSLAVAASNPHPVGVASGLHISKPREVLSSYIPSGNGMVGGTTWITGYNVQSADPAVVAKAHEMLRQQMELSGIPYSEAIDFNRYNFVVGIAASTDAFTDLRKRIVFDEFSNGQYSAENQTTYNLLRGRQFNDLSCHSNGAMICLAAIENHDVKADHVTLFGPQITQESLLMWNDLVAKGRVKSIQIVINANDPVPPVSLLVGGAGTDNATRAMAAMALFSPKILDGLIKAISPAISVRTFSCGAGHPSIDDCHAMDSYRRDLGCRKSTSHAVVPGTTVNGKGTIEPPPPC